MGSGGTISGVGAFLKEKNPGIKIFAVEPDNSAVLSGEDFNPHKIYGLGPNFKSPNFADEVVDEILRVTEYDAAATARELATQAGIPAGLSGGEPRCQPPGRSPNAATRQSGRSSRSCRIPPIATYRASCSRMHSTRTEHTANMSVSEQALEERAARLHQPGKQFTLGGFFTQVPSPADQRARRTYDELIESIVAAEEIGYDSVWIGQHHFSPEDGGVPSPLVVLAAAAARTTRIQLGGTAVVALPFEHPIRLAEDLAVLDEISGGRVQVGLGGARGGDLQAFNTFGVDFSARHELFDRNLEILHHLLEGRECTEFTHNRIGASLPSQLSASDSVAGQQASADVEPKRLYPSATDLRGRLWQTASSEDRARKIARNGNGLMIGAFHDHVIFHQLRFIVGYLEEWLALHGNLEDARVGAQRFTFHGESADAIADELGPHVAATQRTLDDRFPPVGSALTGGISADSHAKRHRIGDCCPASGGTPPRCSGSSPTSSPPPPGCSRRSGQAPPEPISTSTDCASSPRTSRRNSDGNRQHPTNFTTHPKQGDRPCRSSNSSSSQAHWDMRCCSVQASSCCSSPSR